MSRLVNPELLHASYALCPITLRSIPSCILMRDFSGPNLAHLSPRLEPKSTTVAHSANGWGPYCYVMQYENYAIAPHH
jgi:hypothetical protein